MKKHKIYVLHGNNPISQRLPSYLEPIASAEPTRAKYPDAAYSTGPYKTMEAALFYILTYPNPHIITTEDAERLARKHRTHPAPLYSHLRTYRTRTTQGQVTVNLWDTHLVDYEHRKPELAYTLTHKGEIIFAGRGFYPSPLQPIDSLETIYALLDLLIYSSEEYPEELQREFITSNVAEELTTLTARLD